MFRQYESKALQTLKAKQKCVIALGGGTLNKMENSHFLKN
ncbi:MAG: hypothetical protein HWD61_00620 [Parachlamydiaceae bacterium]|nr:MAG: hypothetical protein HWD61_00620 [Parachlamydiaceae bacterium]